MQQSKGKRLRIGTLAQRVGMSQDTVRYYERLGLVRKAARADNGYREYSNTDIGRLLFVRRAKLLGLSLDDIRTLVGLAEEGECWPVRHEVAELLNRKIDQYSAILAELTSFVAQLEERYQIALRHQDESGSVCATFPINCDCLPVTVQEMVSTTEEQLAAIK